MLYRLLVVSCLCSCLFALPIFAQDSLNVTKVGEVAFDHARDVQVSESFAYVIDDSRVVHVVDISNLAMPIEVADCNLDGIPRSLTISEDYLYVAGGYTDGLVIIDIDDPLNPIITGTLSAGIDAIAVAVAGDYAFIAEDG